MAQLKSLTCLHDLDNYPDDYPPCYRRVLSARDISANSLDKSLSKLPNVTLLKDAKESALFVYQHIKKNSSILIVGDYDADGATATTLMAVAFKSLNVCFDIFIPNRKTMGYGLSDKAVDIILEKNPDIVITVDNGISSVNSVDKLKQQGISVIITDHHLLADNVPNADFIVNPNQPDCLFPSQSLAGVGVAFYWVLALRQVYRELEPNYTFLNPADLLPLVAIGTIADLVPIESVNRILVANGLKKIQQQQISLGLKSLCEISGIKLEQINTQDIGFRLAPRINAAGRIADMSLGVDCLMTNNALLAQDYSTELDRLNQERKVIENQIFTEIEKQITEFTSQLSESVLCFYDESWNEGVIGICASKMSRQYSKISFIFAKSDDTNFIKASARSPNAFDISKLLDKINELDSQLLIRYGGHAQAAGLTIEAKNFDYFCVLANKAFDMCFDLSGNDTMIYHDGELLPYEMNIENAVFLSLAEPWGHKYSFPIFCNTFMVEQVSKWSGKVTRFVLTEKNSGISYKAVSFKQKESFNHLKNKYCDIVFKLSVNEWRNQKELSLMIDYINEKPILDHGN